MKKQGKLTFASMLPVAGAMIGLSNCGVYGPPEAPMPDVYGPPEFYEIEEEDAAGPEVYGPPEIIESETEEDTPHNGAVDESGMLYEYYSEDGSVFIRQDYNTCTSVIMDGEEGIPVDIATGIYGPRIEKNDIDGDGEDEYLIAECEGTGTGISVYGFCIVRKDGDEYVLTKYDGEYFTQIIRDRVKYSYDKDTHEITVTVQNSDGETSFSRVIERDSSDEYDLQDVVWGDIIAVSFADGKPYLSAPTGYIFADSPMPDYEDAIEISAPITVDTDSGITVGDFSLGEDDGDKTP